MIALKPLARAKTRLNAPTALRQRIALSMFLDTLTAVSAVADQTLVVSSEPGLSALLDRMSIDASVLVEDHPTGLNPALRLGEARLRATGAELILACVGDLPCLTAASVRAVLHAVDGAGGEAGEGGDADPDQRRRCFVPDAAGIGTTMLIAHRAALEPRFQGRSGQAHLDSGAVALTPAAMAMAAGMGIGTGMSMADPASPELWARVRRDVDTAEDLQSAYRLGVGPWTGALIDPDLERPGVLQTVTVAEMSEPANAFAVITESGSELPLDLAIVHDRTRQLRAGQRLLAVIGSGRVLAAW